jgi:hypothetical protein
MQAASHASFRTAAAGSPVPLITGAAAAIVGTFGLLLTATASAIVAVSTYSGAGTDPKGDSTGPGLFAAASVLAGIGLLVSLALLVGGKDAGRSATAWLAGVTLPWALAMTAYFAAGVSRADLGQRSAVPPLLGVAGAGLASLGLLAGAVLLGIRPGRRWLAHRVLSRTAADASASLRAARARYVVALVVTAAAGAGLLAFLPLSAMGNDPDLLVSIVVLALLQALVSGPLLVATVGASMARSGRRGGAVVARVFSAVPLFVLTVLAMLTMLAGAGSVVGSAEQIAEAKLPPAAALGLSGILAIAFLAGIALVVAGLAALADPHAERAN